MSSAHIAAMSDQRTANLLGALALTVVDRIRRATEGRLGHGGEAPAALITIGHEPGLSNDLLRSALGLTHSGTVRLVDRLQRDGLVERRAGPDGRTIALYLTEGGRAVRTQLLSERAQALAPLIGQLTPEERAMFENILEKLVQSVPVVPTDAYQVCRLCDEQACSDCPMERA